MRRLSLLLVITLFIVTPVFAEGDGHGGGFAAEPPVPPVVEVTEPYSVVTDFLSLFLPF